MASRFAKIASRVSGLWRNTNGVKIAFPGNRQEDSFPEFPRFPKNKQSISWIYRQIPMFRKWGNREIGEIAIPSLSRDQETLHDKKRPKAFSFETRMCDSQYP